MTDKKTYQPMKIVKLGNLDELTKIARLDNRSGGMMHHMYHHMGMYGRR